MRFRTNWPRPLQPVERKLVQERRTLSFGVIPKVLCQWWHQKVQIINPAGRRGDREKELFLTTCCSALVRRQVQTDWMVCEGTSTEPSSSSYFHDSLTFPDRDRCSDRLFLLMTLSSTIPRWIWTGHGGKVGRSHQNKYVALPTRDSDLWV